MLNITKYGIGMVVFGSALDFVTTMIMLSTGLFLEMNSLYYLLGNIYFVLAYCAFTIIVVVMMIFYDRKYSVTHYRLTNIAIFSMSFYGIVHVICGFHNLSVFLSVVGV